MTGAQLQKGAEHLHRLVKAVADTPTGFAMAELLDHLAWLSRLGRLEVLSVRVDPQHEISVDVRWDDGWLTSLRAQKGGQDART